MCVVKYDTFTCVNNHQTIRDMKEISIFQEAVLFNGSENINTPEPASSGLKAESPTYCDLYKVL